MLARRMQRANGHTVFASLQISDHQVGTLVDEGCKFHTRARRSAAGPRCGSAPRSRSRRRISLIPGPRHEVSSRWLQEALNGAKFSRLQTSTSARHPMRGICSASNSRMGHHDAEPPPLTTNGSSRLIQLRCARRPEEGPAAHDRA
jgi:hypothetical protein